MDLKISDSINNGLKSVLHCLRRLLDSFSNSCSSFSVNLCLANQCFPFLMLSISLPPFHRPSTYKLVHFHALSDGKAFLSTWYFGKKSLFLLTLVNKRVIMIKSSRQTIILSGFCYRFGGSFCTALLTMVKL